VLASKDGDEEREECACPIPPHVCLGIATQGRCVCIAAVVLGLFPESELDGADCRPHLLAFLERQPDEERDDGSKS
jgi:hypothetical protein